MEKVVDFFQSQFDSLLSPTGTFSDSMLDNEMYSLFLLISFFSSLAFVVMYYYIINRSTFNQRYHWSLIMRGLLVLLNVLLSIFYLQYRFTALDLSFLMGDYIKFAIAIAITTGVLYYLLSWILKWWSSNASNYPNLSLLKSIYNSIFKSK